MPCTCCIMPPSAHVEESSRLWSAKIGQDFVPQCNLLSIDYCSIHLWPDNWNTYAPTFPTTWLTAHEQAAKTLNKPLILEEVRCSLAAIQALLLTVSEGMTVFIRLLADMCSSPAGTERCMYTGMKRLSGD